MSLLHFCLVKILIQHRLSEVGDDWKSFLTRNQFREDQIWTKLKPKTHQKRRVHVTEDPSLAVHAYNILARDSTNEYDEADANVSSPTYYQLFHEEISRDKGKKPLVEDYETLAVINKIKTKCHEQTVETPIGLASRRITRSMAGTLPRRQKSKNDEPQLIHLTNSEEQLVFQGEGNDTPDPSPSFHMYDLTSMTRERNACPEHVTYPAKQWDERDKLNSCKIDSHDFDSIQNANHATRVPNETQARRIEHLEVQVKEMELINSLFKDENDNLKISISQLTEEKDHIIMRKAFYKQNFFKLRAKVKEARRIALVQVSVDASSKA